MTTPHVAGGRTCRVQQGQAIEGSARSGHPPDGNAEEGRKTLDSAYCLHYVLWLFRFTVLTLFVHYNTFSEYTVLFQYRWGKS